MNRQQRRLAERQARKNPGANPAQLLELAMRAYQAGQLEKARAHCQKLLAANPKYADALELRGLIELGLNNPHDACKFLKRATAVAPDETRLHHNLGEAQLAAGNSKLATTSFRRAAVLAPDRPDAHLGLANALFSCGEFARAVESYQRALAIAPADPDIVLNLSNALEQSGDVEAAIKVTRQGLARAPNHVPLMLNLGKILQCVGRYDEAIELYREAISEDPDLAGAYAELGYCLQVLGHFSEARPHLERALEIEPNNIASTIALVADLGESVDDSTVGRVETLLMDDGIGDNDRISLHFVLGKVYDRSKQYEAAFENYQKGNALKARQRPYEPEFYQSLVDRSVAVFTKSFFSSQNAAKIETELPVFVVGMPRSGTTLVEQIIGSHGAAVGAGELPAIAAIAAQLANWCGRPYPENLEKGLPEPAGDYFRSHLDWLEERAAGGSRVVDKTPSNFLHLGLIACVLPGAKIIHCRRNALDTGLSCYFQEFESGQEFSYEVEWIGHYYRQYQRLMAHWRTVLPISILNVDYEDLVADQVKQSRRIISFCDLAWDDACLTFNEARGAVTTASRWQVRQPMYRSSAGKWKRYADFLSPLSEAIGDPG